MPIEKDFSKILRSAMRKQNLSQFEIATMLGVSQQTISSWKLGTRRPQPRHKRILLQMNGEKTMMATPEPSMSEIGKNIDRARTRITEDLGVLADIAEKSHLSWKNLELVLEHLPCAVWCGVFRKNGFVPTFANKGFRELTGRPDYDEKRWRGSAVPLKWQKAYRSFHQLSIRSGAQSVHLDHEIIPGGGGEPVHVREIRNVQLDEDGAAHVFAIIVLLDGGTAKGAGKPQRAKIPAS
jgi:transcriptional regulator with XRE-family HTH domain